MLFLISHIFCNHISLNKTHRSCELPSAPKMSLRISQSCFFVIFEKKFADNPFKISKAFEGAMLKVNSTSQCTCSGITLITTIFILCNEATLLIQAVAKERYFSFLNILYLYFVHHSKCQIEIPTDGLVSCIHLSAFPFFPRALAVRKQTFI